LELAENQLTRIPPTALRPLKALTFLDLRRNALVQLPVLPAHGVLDSLLISDNELPHLEDAGLEACSMLTVLDAKDNKLTRLSVEVTALPLKVLDVSNNDLSDLPPELGMVVSLRRLLLDGNPMKKIRRALLDQGAEALKKYLRTRLSDPEAAEASFAAASRAVAAAGPGVGAGSTASSRDRSAAAVAPSGSASAIPLHLVTLYDAVQQASYALQQNKGVLALNSRPEFVVPAPGASAAAARSGVSVSQWPSAVWTTPWTAVELENNAIEELPDRFELLIASLTRLSVNHNRLTVLPLSVFACDKLTTVAAAHNALTSDSWLATLVATASAGPRRLPLVGLGRVWPRLRALDLNHNPLTTFPLAALSLPCLEVLDVSFCGLTGALPDFTCAPCSATLVVHNVY
jgi:Leucine-rich repeat (LRR) protein